MNKSSILRCKILKVVKKKKLKISEWTIILRALEKKKNVIASWILLTMDGGQNFERRNVEQLTFRNFKIVNIKITKNVLFDNFIIKFIFSFLEII